MPVVLSDSLLEKLELSQTDLNAGYAFHDYNSQEMTVQYITSLAVNRHIRIDKIKLELLDHPYEVPETIARYAKIMLDHQLSEAEEGQIEDHRVFGLYSNLSPESDHALIGVAKYFDTVATYKSYPYDYVNENGNVEFVGSSFVYNEFGVVYPLGLRRSCNPIGASTMALTADRKLLIQVQPDSDPFKPGRLMPSGSGITSYHDYREGQTLQDLVAHCAEYKLMQECKIPEEAIIDTAVLGMARVYVGMKPDFFCVTELNQTWDELVAQGAEAYDVLSVAPRQRPSEVLRSYVAQKNQEKPGACSIQIYLAAEFLAEVCR